jgi:hypothetical protein
MENDFHGFSGLRFKWVIGRFDLVRNKKIQKNKIKIKIVTNPTFGSLDFEYMEPEIRES